MILVSIPGCSNCEVIKRKFPDWTYKIYPTGCSLIEKRFIQKHMKKYKIDQFPVAISDKMDRFYTLSDILSLVNVKV